MNEDDYLAAPLTPRQKRVLRIGLTVYLVFMGTYTILHNDFSAAFFYAMLSVVDFYFYNNVSEWIRAKKR